jgi:Periplasmic protein TonB, links inner and outer membranes
MKPAIRTFRRAMLPVLALLCVAPAWGQSAALRVGQQDLYRYWILLNTSVSMNAPNSGLNLDKPGCAAVTYTIGSDGVPLNARVAKVVPRSDLGSVALSAVSNFRYGPSLKNHDDVPVATYYIVPFNAPADAAQRQQLTDACKLPGYGS